MTVVEKFGAFVLGAIAIIGIGSVATVDIRRERMTKDGIDRASRQAVDNYIVAHPIDIPNQVVDNAIRDYTSRHIREQVDRAGNDIRSKAKARVEAEVQSVMNEERTTYAKRLADEFERKLNRTDIRDTVAEEVREQFMDKLDDIITNTVNDYVREKGERIIKNRVDSHLNRRNIFDAPW